MCFYEKDDSMIVIGDSLIAKLDKNKFIVNTYPGISLNEYLIKYNELKSVDDISEEDIVVYSFGINDLNNGIPSEEVISGYNKLKHGKATTFIIIPPFQNHDFIDQCERILSEDFEFIYAFTENYRACDGLHPSKESLSKLEDELLEITS
jgi:hypothetical protein